MRRLAHGVVGDEVLVEHDPRLVHQVHARIGPTVPIVILGDVGVADAEGVDDGTVDVGQQGILDTETAGESRQKIRWIRADGVDFDAFTEEGGTLLLQFDQLRLAEASPGG